MKRLGLPTVPLRLLGVALTTLGACIIAGTLLWLGAYHVNGFLYYRSIQPLSHLGWWLPVSMFLVPGVLFLRHGRILHRGAPLTAPALAELLVLVALAGIVAVIALLPETPCCRERAADEPARGAARQHDD